MLLNTVTKKKQYVIYHLTDSNTLTNHFIKASHNTPLKLYINEYYINKNHPEKPLSIDDLTLDTSLSSKMMKQLLSVRQSYQKRAKTFLTRSLKHKSSRALLSGMMGIKIYDRGLQYITKNTGLSHLLAISGLHFSVLLGTLTWFTFFMKKRFIFIFHLFFMLYFALLMGDSPSIFRAGVMNFFSILGTYKNRQYNRQIPFFFSASLALSIHPSWIYNIGFWLSYLCTFSILFFYPHLSNLINNREFKYNWILDIVILNISVCLWTFPLCLCAFGTFPISSIFFNLIYPPIISLFYSITFFAFMFHVFFGFHFTIIMKPIDVLINKLVLFICKIPDIYFLNIKFELNPIFATIIYLYLYILTIKLIDKDRDKELDPIKYFLH
ncbi:ComEC/Rec2 family competence protein [Chlamydiia bacterium]|nr:ComEC/Rec2 family competence protein [Chlamydiia bacterium]